MTAILRCNLRLSEVHATTETVGREFRKLTDRFGMECVSELLPPVVRALEWLETYVESYQQLQTTVSELEMENDTLEYEREQRALLADKNESLAGTIRDLQKENRCLLMEMDEIYFKNQELSGLLEKALHPVQHTVITTDLVAAETSSSSPAPSSPPPHSPNRVVHLSHIYPSPPSSHSPHFTPSPPPTLPASLLRSSPADSTPTPTPTPQLSHSHPSPPTLPSPESQPQDPSLHTLPVSPLPSPSLHHHHLPKSHPPTPSATRAHRVIQTVGRSSSLSDMAKVRVQHHHLHDDEEDMFERSRVTRRLSKVETELETTAQQLGDLQRSRERLMDENKQLKIQVEKLQAEVSLESIVSNHGDQPTEEVPRYYKRDVVQVLTERNRLKEQVHSLQEELGQLRDALKRTATGTRSRRGKPVMNGVAGTANRERGRNSVRSILTESIHLESYPTLQLMSNGSPQKKHS